MGLDDYAGTGGQATKLGYDDCFFSSAPLFSPGQKLSYLLATMTATTKFASSFCSHSDDKIL